MSTDLSFLVIENAPDVCEGIIRRMIPFTNWKSQGYALSVKEAIRKIEENRPHLLFLDWGLNGGSAFEVMQSIHQFPDYHPYIIFNTGFQRDNPEIPQELINHYKVDKYLIKPIWENLKLNLPAYLQEAEEKARRPKEAAKKTWLDDISGKKIFADLSQLICICQHPVEPRQRILYFNRPPSTITLSLQWHKCYELLNRFQISFFITKNRSHLVCKPFVEVFEKPFVRLSGFPAKIEVVKESAKAFEDWLEAH